MRQQFQTTTALPTRDGESAVVGRGTAPPPSLEVGGNGSRPFAALSPSLEVGWMTAAVGELRRA
ncbi:hypothetical protein [Methyloglobulus sp.]|uniref:hypothetical protein n=1 Tax=Methyloglobulus sp. TaxID=2518622 RepID=UPI003989113B